MRASARQTAVEIKSWFVSALCLLLLPLAALAGDGAPARTVTVMAPLLLQSNQDWDHFRGSLRAAKRAGVDAVTADIWWGLVQAGGPEHFDWSYYHRMANEIRAAGLKWIPIMST